MISACKTAPDDRATLQKLIIQKDKQLDEYKSELLFLKEQIRLLLNKKFGPRSEKTPDCQLSLFNEAESLAESEKAVDEETVTVPEHKRKKTGRKPLPADLPRIDVIHDLPEDEKICAHDGEALTVIGREVSEQLEYIPAKMQVIRNIRLKYGCKLCEEGVKTAPMPPQPIPKSMATPGLLAHVAVSKYVDGLPLYRMEKVFQRINIDISRATLAGWMIKSGQLIQPLINLMREEILSGPLIHMDETPVQVLKENGKTAQSKSYMWVQKGGKPDHPLILYDYSPSRSGKVPVKLLEDFSGYLMTDGYDGYGAVCLKNGITWVGCWAHARRKFDEAWKAQGKSDGKAQTGLDYIRKLYRIEKSVKDASAEERLEIRQREAAAVLSEMRQWLDRSLRQAPPKSMIGKALNYLRNQWQKLVLYCEDGQIPIDNNTVENAIRPFALGRKNWLFSATVAGAEASANLYSLIESAKANGHEPYRYLSHIFKELPKSETVKQIEALLPNNVKPGGLA